MVVIVRERGMNLRERQMSMLEVDFLWTPPVRQLVHDDFDNFGVRSVDPGDTVVVHPNMSFGFGWHRFNRNCKKATVQRLTEA